MCGNFYAFLSLVIAVALGVFMLCRYFGPTDKGE